LEYFYVVLYSFQRSSTREAYSGAWESARSKLRHWPPATIQNTVRGAFFLNQPNTPPNLLTHPPANRIAAPNGHVVRTLRSRKTIYVLVFLLLFVAAGLACVPSLRRERQRLLILRNLAEQAAAPDEPVLVTDWIVYRFLRWKGSPALQQQMIFAQKTLPPAVLAASQEIIVIAADNDPLPATLRAKGFLLTQDATQQPWIVSGQGVRLPGRGIVRIYFGVRSGMATVSSQPELEKP